MSETQKTEKTRMGNGAVVAMCCSFVIGMGAMAYAAVPLYEMFCKVTGYGGTTQRVEQASDVILDKKIKDGSGAEHPIRIGIIGFVPPQIMVWDLKNLEGNVKTRDIVE
ncbi:MAG: cytochrome c oxidase assembly protein, partial [Shinella sp.]|uniref:cytochrome c oxidase assembly protein n=1 Tax=Shinella sp. TaxID=1870904 RepID=UPI0040367569